MNTNKFLSKTFLFSAFLLMFTLLGTTPLEAQEKDHNKTNYVVLTNKIPQLQPIILAAEALKAEQSSNFGSFKVIICGKDIGGVTDADQMTKFIKMAEKAGVDLIACGFSLNKFKVERTNVPKEMTIVENGILYNFQLQNKGYKSITL